MYSGPPFFGVGSTFGLRNCFGHPRAPLDIGMAVQSPRERTGLHKNIKFLDPRTIASCMEC